MKEEYTRLGYWVARGVFTPSELQPVKDVIAKFHQLWQVEHAQFYATQAINSAYLTAKQYLNDQERKILFSLIGSNKLMSMVNALFDGQPAFMNTQLFFDPVNHAQKNYWHRDPQYHMTLEEQKRALLGPKVIHFRLPLVNEPGIELVAGTHQRWDTDEELNIRLEQNGRKHYEDLSHATKIPLDAGDVLVFDANMIHRGLYGMNRLSLDILFCDPKPELMAYVNEQCLPEFEVINSLDDGRAFANSIRIKNGSSN